MQETTLAKYYHKSRSSSREGDGNAQMDMLLLNTFVISSCICCLWHDYIHMPVQTHQDRTAPENRESSWKADCKVGS